MTVRRAVDFLIVVALQPELEAAIRHFGPVEQGSGEYFATVPRRGGGKYQVAIVNIGDMGPESAQRETNAALSRLRVNRVILIGIAAGFPESGVEYGDLMLPLWIVDYEKSKVSDGWWGLRHLKIQDRGHEFRVNQALYHAAQTIAASTGGGWGTRVSVPRPDGSVQLAGVRHGPDSAIGSGSKLVASRLFSTRKRLVAKGTLGVEMEAIGVVHACLMRDTPVLVLKASQDYATSQKDAPKEKDKWRAYACDVAAAFARELVEMFVVSHDSLIAQHLAKLDVAMQGPLARNSSLRVLRTARSNTRRCHAPAFCH